MIAGRAVDRIGSRPMILGGWGLYAGIYLGFAVASAQWHVWLLFVGYAMFYAFTESAEKTLVANLVGPDQRGLGLRLVQCGGWHRHTSRQPSLRMALPGVWCVGGLRCRCGSGIAGRADAVGRQDERACEVDQREAPRNGKAHPASSTGQAYLADCSWTGLVCPYCCGRGQRVKEQNRRVLASSFSYKGILRPSSPIITRAFAACRRTASSSSPRSRWSSAMAGRASVPSMPRRSAAWHRTLSSLSLSIPLATRREVVASPVIRQIASAADNLSKLVSSSPPCRRHCCKVGIAS